MLALVEQCICCVATCVHITGAFGREFFLYIFSIMILQKYMVRQTFCKTIHLSPWLTASGVNAVAHGVRDLTPWPTAVGAASSGPVVSPPQATALGGYCQAAAWPPGNAASHDGMYGLTVVGCGGSFFFKLQFLKH
jgi:hypothetical protein